MNHYFQNTLFSDGECMARMAMSRDHASARMTSRKRRPKMLSSRKIQFVILLITGFILMPLFAAEPNEPNEPNQLNTAIEYDISEGKPPEVEIRRYPPPYGATHLTFVYIRGGAWGEYIKEKYLDAMLQTQAGRKMSQLQKELLSGKYVNFANYGTKVGGYCEFVLYGVSLEDTKKVVEAFLEFLTKQAQQNIKSNKESLQYYKEKLEKAKNELPEKEKRLEKLEERYEKFKALTHHMFSNTDEAFSSVKESLMENDKALDKIKIEMSVIREKLEAIEIYKERATNEVEEKLDEMQVNLMIELKGLEARKRAVEEIRYYENEFLSSYIQLKDSRSEISGLKSSIGDSEREIDSITKRLENREELMQPPHVLQNKVEIFPLK